VLALAALLVLSLILLSTLTTIVQLRSRRLNREIAEVLLPAGALVKDVQVALSIETSTLNGFALTGDETLLTNYTDARKRQARALGLLAPLVAQIDEEAAGRYARLDSYADQWNAVTPRFESLRARALGDTGRRTVDLEERLSSETLAAAVGVEDAINAAMQKQRARIDASERLDWQSTLILSIVAIVAGLAALWLGLRVRQLAWESERRRVEIEKVLDSKARLMRGLSHDLRNPLDIVDGYAHILQLGARGDLTIGQRELVQRIHRAVASSVAILDNILDLSRAEAGYLTVSASAVNMLALLEEIIDDQLVPVEMAGLEFTTDLAEALPVVETDPARVRQILGNLLSNAIKYTPRGGSVALAASVRSGSDAPGKGDWLSIDVTDTGRGIAPAERELIFEEFYRIEGSAQQARGLGVGLAISREIARLLGGDLTVRSEEGKGSTFTLWLQLPA
jgi:signal transduction histidine kinase